MRQAVRVIVIKDQSLLVMHRNKFGQQFYALVGGGIDYGENPEQALYREVAEETGLQITNPKLVIIEDAGDVYGMQYIYTCDYVSGEPALAADSAEALIHAKGENLYTPMWLPLSDLPNVVFQPKELQATLIAHATAGWPAAPIELLINS
ncbi:MAG: NUDIX domain-containing protein [Patescibacteria group bacterium]|nr:NUDIX domain-containing protein [Patescibacteria group bacterium]